VFAVNWLLAFVGLEIVPTKPETKVKARKTRKVATEATEDQELEGKFGELDLSRYDSDLDSDYSASELSGEDDPLEYDSQSEEPEPRFAQVAEAEVLEGDVEPAEDVQIHAEDYDGEGEKIAFDAKITESAKVEDKMTKVTEKIAKVDEKIVPAKVDVKIAADAKKTVPAKVEKVAEPAIDAKKAAPAKAEPAKIEPAKIEPAKAELTIKKTEPVVTAEKIEATKKIETIKDVKKTFNTTSKVEVAKEVMPEMVTKKA